MPVTWKDGGKSIEYRSNGRLHPYDIAIGKIEVKADAGEGEGLRGCRGGFPGVARRGQGGPPGVAGQTVPPPPGGRMFM